MTLKTMFMTFGLIFLAELGDKTQLATIMLVAKTKEPFSVLVGGAVALAIVTAIGVAAGSLLSNYINPAYLHKAAAVGFIILGALMLWDMI